MKKTWKKITSLFLSLLLMLSMVVTPVMLFLKFFKMFPRNSMVHHMNHLL